MNLHFHSSVCLCTLKVQCPQAKTIEVESYMNYMNVCRPKCIYYLCYLARFALKMGSHLEKIQLPTYILFSS